MHGPTVPVKPSGSDGCNARQFARIPLLIPVHVELLPVASGAAAMALGTLLNIGCGGGLLRLRRELSAGARIHVRFPLMAHTVRLPGEVIWRIVPSDHEHEPTVYGLRWAKPLSSGILESILIGEGPDLR